MGAGVTGADVVGLSCTMTEDEEFTERLELTAAVEFAVLDAGVTVADVVGLLMAAAEFTERLELSATLEFEVLDAGVVGADVVGLLRAAAEFIERLDLTATVDFTVLGARVTGGDFVGLLKIVLKTLGNTPKPKLRLEPERPPNCGFASTAQAKNTGARSICKTENKIQVHVTVHH